MNILKGIGTVIAGAVTIAALVLGLWWVGWWFTAQNTNKQAHINRSNFGYQQTLRDQITKGIGDYNQVGVDATWPGANTVALEAQQHAILNIICGEAVQVTGDPLPPDQLAFVSTNCVNGVAR